MEEITKQFLNNLREYNTLSMDELYSWELTYQTMARDTASYTQAQRDTYKLRALAITKRISEIKTEKLLLGE